MKLLTPEELAQALTVSRATVFRMCSNGDLPHVIIRAGRRKKVIRFRAEEIEGWLCSRTCGGTAGPRLKRKSGRIGNGVATEKKSKLQACETKRENERRHGTDSLVPGA